MAGCPATWNAHLPGGDKLEEKNALINAGMEMSAQREPDINGRFPRTLRTLACPAGKYGDEKYE